MTCKYCGATLPENAKFCPGCAAKVENDGLDVILTEGENQTLETPLSIEKVYELLECDKYYNEKTGVTAFTNSFKMNPSVYRVAGMKPFSQRSNEIKSRLEKWCADWLQKAEDEWRRTSLEKVTKFKVAITALSAQFCKASDEKFKEQIEEPLWDFQIGKLTEVVKNLGSDGKIDSQEQLSLLSTIKSLGLDAKDLRKKVTGFIESYAKENKIRMTSYWEDFLDYFKGLKQTDQIDTEKNKKALLLKYAELKKIDEDFYAKSHSPTSMDEMLKVMDIQGVSFKSPAKIFKIQAEECLAKNQVNPNEPLDEKVYSRLRVIADDLGISDADFENYMKENGIKKPSGVTITKDTQPSTPLPTQSTATSSTIHADSAKKLEEALYGQSIPKKKENVIAPNTGRREPKYVGISPKSRLVAGLLGLFFGYYGVHLFYLGRKKEGFFQLLYIIALFLLISFLDMDGIVGLAIGIVALVLVVLKPFVQTLKIFAGSEKDGKNLPVKNWT